MDPSATATRDEIPPPARPGGADAAFPRVLIFGCGNLLLSDEGFGVQLIRHLQEQYEFPPNVRLFDGGTLGILVAHELEQADAVIIIDTVRAEGRPGQVFRFTKPDFMLRRLPLKLSPHQIGVQEMLVVSELRGHCPAEIVLLGVLPETIAPGCNLSPALQSALELVARLVRHELERFGVGAERESIAGRESP